MEPFATIANRRSIRRYSTQEVPRELLEKIIKAAIDAPSAKNRQPWRFVVVTEKEKANMLEAMRAGIENEKSGLGLLPNFAVHLRGAEYTMAIMRQAPVTIFILNTEKHYLWETATVEEKLFEATNLQSIGAAIQNMLLSAHALGLGSLWVGDIFFAYRELTAWLNTEEQLVAAVTLGYPRETPNPRPRKKVQEVTEWR